jgi:copper(I)-binding protein
MNQKPDGAGQDELSVAARIKAHMSGLDRYIPVPPPFESIEGRLRPGAAEWGSGRRIRTERRGGWLRRPFGALLAAAAIVMAAALVLGPRLWLTAVGPAGTGGTPSATASTPAGMLVTDAQARPIAGSGNPVSVTAVITNRTDSNDKLLGASSPIAASGGLYATCACSPVPTDSTGLADTSRMPWWAIAINETIQLRAGSGEVILNGLASPLAPGQTIEVTFEFAVAPPVTVKVPVVGPAGTATATTPASFGPTATPSAAGSVHQKTILDSGTDSVDAATWSPGGTKIAVVLGNSGQSLHIQILWSDGTPIESVDASELAWIDDTTYVALNGAVKAFVGHVGSSAHSDLPGAYPCGLLRGSPGVVALMTDATCTDQPTQYVIWTPKGLSAPRSGLPVAFSPDGTLLAVVHDPTPCCEGGPTPDPSASPPPKATLDIVRTSTGVSVAHAGNLSWASGTNVLFSPDAKRVAYLMRMPERPSGDGFAILDIASGTVSGLDSGLGKVLGWMANDRLLVASQAPGAPTPKGLQATAFDTDADIVALSSTGWVAAALAGNQATQSLTLTLGRGAERETTQLPGYARVLAWSADGSTLLVVCSDSSMHPPDQVVLVQP